MTRRWLWRDRRPLARLARSVLQPVSLTVRTVAAAKAAVYRLGLMPKHAPGIPAVAVGNLSVGGTGKTPLASWIAQYSLSKRVTPAIVLRGYGGDEGAVHRRLVPAAIVVEDANRRRGVASAIHAGAGLIVFDDAFQRLELKPDINIALVSAESAGTVPWVVPAGPWREGWRALSRADLVVVTRKSAGGDEIDSVRRRIQTVVERTSVISARLGISGFRGMLSGSRLKAGDLAGTQIVVSAGIADPEGLAGQCTELGASVTLRRWTDHHAFSAGDARLIAADARGADWVVVTEKDAVKLEHLWPRTMAEPLVAELSVEWEDGGEYMSSALDELLSRSANGGTVL